MSLVPDAPSGWPSGLAPAGARGRWRAGGGRRGGTPGGGARRGARGTRRAERVAERDGAAMDVEPFRIGSDLPLPRERNGREGLVHFVKVDGLDPHGPALPRPPGGGD